jgi:hypothetical protein
MKRLALDLNIKMEPPDTDTTGWIYEDFKVCFKQGDDRTCISKVDIGCMYML